MTNQSTSPSDFTMGFIIGLAVGIILTAIFVYAISDPTPATETIRVLDLDVQQEEPPWLTTPK